MIWFTSDTHFGHANIIKYDRRPFSDIVEHDNELIRRWNVVVGKGDVVYHLGDFSWHNKEAEADNILVQLNGTKILVYGNHDSKAVKRCAAWTKVTPYEEVTYQEQKICLFHYRMVVWNRSHHGSWALHGHSHGSLPVNYQAKTLDVGTMCWAYAPVSFNEIAEAMKAHTFTPVDQHGKEWHHATRTE